jgi:hypothetical protein
MGTLQGNLDGALEGLLNIEKQQRLAEEITTCKLACAAIVQVLYDAKQWKLLNENILLLAKRRSQLKQASLSRPSNRSPLNINTKFARTAWVADSEPQAHGGVFQVVNSRMGRHGG